MIQQISTRELIGQRDNPNVAVVDGRPTVAFNSWRMPGEARGGHIPGWINLPLGCTALVKCRCVGINLVLLLWMFSVAGLGPTASRAGHANPTMAAAVGNEAPNFAVADLDGQVHTLRAYQGRPVILNFWATWCVPCRREMPLLKMAYERHQAAALAVLAVSQDPHDSQATVRSYVADAGLSFQVLLDPDGRVADDYNVFFLPSTVFVNAKGVITGIHRGPFTADQLERYLVAMLAP